MVGAGATLNEAVISALRETRAALLSQELT